MLGTVALVVVITLTALAVVLYAAYCEAGEDWPCKKAQRGRHVTRLRGRTTYKPETINRVGPKKA